jgi:hypothetical protein
VPRMVDSVAETGAVLTACETLSVMNRATTAFVALGLIWGSNFLSDLDIPPVALTTYQIGLALLTLTVVTDLDGITAITGDPGRWSGW